jgi:predicted TIM-barrel fold metal-dependent hydrolase
MNVLKKYSCRLAACLLLAVVLLLAPFFLGAAHPCQPSQPLPATPFIDMHCHTAGIGAGGSGCFVSDRLMHSYKLYFYLKSFGVTREEISREGDALILRRISEKLAASRHVGRAVILALDGAVDAHGELDRARTEIYVPNEFLAAEIPKYPNLLWGASVNPYRPDALARLEWAKAHGAVLVKWLPSIQHIDPADERLIPFYQKLVELHLPLLCHTGTENSFTQAEDELCDPDRLRLALRTGVTVIAAHAGTPGKFHGERSFDRLARLMPEYPNLYTDISSLTQVNKLGYLGETLRRPEFQHRLVYGTDYPLIEISLLASPWYFPGQLTFRQMRAFAGTNNPWDRDVALKQALGVPAEVWTRADSLLALPGR